MKFNSSISIVALAIVAGAFFIAATFAWTPAQGQDRPHIQRKQLDTMFSSMRARTPWNVDGPLLWGYFFYSPSSEKLQQLAAVLKGKGYRVVSIEAAGEELRLHVERVETHTPASLDTRNQELYTLAERHEVFYDGMDVGPAQGREEK